MKEKLNAEGLTKVVASLCKENDIPFVVCIAKDGPTETIRVAANGPVAEIVYELEALKMRVMGALK